MSFQNSNSARKEWFYSSI